MDWWEGSRRNNATNQPAHAQSWAVQSAARRISLYPHEPQQNEEHEPGRTQNNTTDDDERIASM